MNDKPLAENDVLAWLCQYDGSVHKKGVHHEGDTPLVAQPQTENDDTLWLVTKEGVYDHGVCYVGLTEADAQQFTQDFAPDDDGYHEWRIDPIKVGVPTGYTTVRRVSPSGQEA